MSTTQESRTSRGIRRRKAVIDLNEIPRDHEGTTSSAASVRESPTVAPPPSGGGLSVPSQPVPTMIDVDAIEDDIIESSASAFAEAKSKSSGGRRRRPLMVDVESGGLTRLPANISNKRRRIPPNQPVIDCEHVPVDVRESSPKPPPPPPEEPKFSCPICMSPFTEETSTKCGHIFCKGCIKQAISRQAKCPTCRKRVTNKELIRVFLPTTR
ncbi:unnamed protein product [Eruca vesicaria subsp. sativa]|uniref:RING-type domain-containing protein n=1 Tax=Eruca vesicaria subsp. sativa TaxID=29727 RepID=A0ABC8L331_ERUVS|nr:unnamed protein product [Eruca vesicaria subsp. sativa]